MTRDRQRARRARTERSRGAVLRAVRLALRVPLDLLSSSTGIPPTTLSAYELGRRALPLKAQKRMEVDLHRLFTYAVDAADCAEGLGLTKAAPRLRGEA